MLLRWEEKRSGSAEPVLELNGSEEANGSSEENVVEEDCLKKESVANGSVPLKGSPPNGSGQKGEHLAVVWFHIKTLSMQVYPANLKCL